MRTAGSADSWSIVDAPIFYTNELRSDFSECNTELKKYIAAIDDGYLLGSEHTFQLIITFLVLMMVAAVLATVSSCFRQKKV